MGAIQVVWPSTALRVFSSRRLPASFATLAVLAALLAYGPAVGSPFSPIDDSTYVLDNTVLQELRPSEAWRVFVSVTNPWEYLPLRDLSYVVDLNLFGLDPAAFRIHNLILYGLTCGAVWWFVWGLVGLLGGRAESARPWVAALSTAIFALHPAHVESVIWIAGRKDVLSGLFGVLSLALFTHALGTGRSSRRWLAGAYAAFGCAVLSKSTVTPVPVVALAIAFLGQTRSMSPSWSGARRAVLITAPLFLLALASVGLQVWVSSTYDAAQFEGSGYRSPLDRLLLSTRILGTLARVSLAPTGLRLIYDVDAPGAPALAATALGATAAALGILGLWLGVKRRSLAWLGCGVSGILTAPFLQLIPFSTWSYASERFLFLPVIGVAISLAGVISRLPTPVGAVAAGLLLVSFGAGSASRAALWDDFAALCANAASLAPAHHQAVKLAIDRVYVPAGRFAEARVAASGVREPEWRSYLSDQIDARDAYRRGDRNEVRRLVMKLMPVVPRADFGSRLEIANLALEVGLLGDAEAEYRGMLTDFRKVAVVHYDLGLVLKRLGRNAEAATSIQAAIDGGCVTADVWNNLGLVCRDSGQVDRASAAFRSALDADRTHWHAGYNLARLLWARGNRDGARRALEESRARAVASGAKADPLDELARLFAASDRVGSAPVR